MTDGHRGTRSSTPWSNTIPLIWKLWPTSAGGGFGEVEVHLHHDNDTAENLREHWSAIKASLSAVTASLPGTARPGSWATAFVHGNWALDNSRPDGRWCGVNNELTCSARRAATPISPCLRPPTRRRLGRLTVSTTPTMIRTRPKSHDGGVDVGRGSVPGRGLMMIQGPLVLKWGNRKWGVLPRLENGCIQESQPPSLNRLPLWIRARVQICTRPDWYFVKLHTHGAPEANRKVLLGEPMVRFHQDLARLAAENPQFQYHYVTAREMYNLARAAEGGWAGSVDVARDHELLWEGSPKSRLANYPATGGEAERPTGIPDELRATKG